MDKRNLRLCCIPGCDNMTEAPPGELALCTVHVSLNNATIRKLVPPPNFDAPEPAPAERRVQAPEKEAPTRGAGLKFDQGKPRPYLLIHGMPTALSQIADVLTFGAQKYAAHSWRQVENGQERYSDALFRHLLARANGEVNDPETGLPHLAHAACNIMFLMELEQAALKERQ